MTTEQTVLVACCHPRFDDDLRHRIAALLDTERIDWTVLVASALAHRVVPALLSTLRRVADALVPGDLMAALEAFEIATQNRNEQLLTALLMILSELERDGVQAIPFKGPFLAQRLYGELSSRTSVDIDFLVRKSDVSQVWRVLHRLGYEWRPGMRRFTEAQHRMYRRYQCEYQLVRMTDGIIVEPHWAFTQRALGVDLDYEAIFNRATRITIRDTWPWTLSTEDLLLTLCIHGAKHEWNRLGWIRDIAVFLESQPIDFDVMMTRARAQGCGRILNLGIGVATRYVGARLPSTVQRLIDQDRIAARLSDYVGAALFASRGETSYARLTSFRFQMRERQRDRFRYVARTLLLPNLVHVELVKLPRSLIGLYYPLRWIHDYLALPVWLAGKWARRALPRARPVTDVASR